MKQYLILLTLIPLVSLSSNCSGLSPYSDSCLVANPAELTFSANYTHETKTLDSEIILSGTALSQKSLIHGDYCNFALSIIRGELAANAGDLRKPNLSNIAYAFYQEDSSNTAKCSLSVVLDHNMFDKEETFTVKLVKLEGVSLISRQNQGHDYQHLWRRHS